MIFTKPIDRIFEFWSKERKSCTISECGADGGVLPSWEKSASLHLFFASTPTLKLPTLCQKATSNIEFFKK